MTLSVAVPFALLLLSATQALSMLAVSACMLLALCLVEQIVPLKIQ